MSSSQAICASFAQELLTATHDFSVAGDTFKMALYSSSATLNVSTTAYSATNEIAGTNYTAGGASLTNVAPVASGAGAYCSFADASWAALTATGIRYGLIYNSSKSNKSVVVLDFGFDKSSTAQTFQVTMPAAGLNTAIIRIGTS